MKRLIIIISFFVSIINSRCFAQSKWNLYFIDPVKNELGKPTGDWGYYFFDENSMVVKKNIATGNTIKVWIKVIRRNYPSTPTKAEQEAAKKQVGLYNKDYAEMLLEVNCRDRTYWIVEYTGYVNGVEKYHKVYSKISSTWKNISPQSMEEGLWNWIKVVDK